MRQRGERNAALRGGPDRCDQDERSFGLPGDVAVRACVLQRGGLASLAPASERCGPATLSLTIPDEERTLRFCALDPFPWLRHVGDGCKQGEIPVFVPAANRAPAARNLAARTNEDAPRAFTLPASDPDGDRLSYRIVRAPAHGRLSGTDANRTYTPNKD